MIRELTKNYRSIILHEHNCLIGLFIVFTLRCIKRYQRKKRFGHNHFDAKNVEISALRLCVLFPYQKCSLGFFVTDGRTDRHSNPFGGE